MRRGYARGSKRGLDNAIQDDQAIAEVKAARFAYGARINHKSMVDWWISRCRARRLRPFPLTVRLLELAAGLLKRGRYRSGPMFLSALRREHVELLHPWSHQLSLAQSDLARALKRGLGPNRQADALPETFERPRVVM